MKKCRRIKITAFRRRTTVVLRKQDGRRIGTVGFCEGTEKPQAGAETDLTPSLTPQSKIGEMIMKAKTRILRMLVAVVLSCGFFHLQPSTSAQSAKGFMGLRGKPAPSTSSQSPNSNCKKLKGIRIDVFDPATGIVNGTVTHAGILNGTTEDVIDFAAGFVVTPDPNVVAYTGDSTITTNHGQLRTRPVTTQSIVTGVFTQFGNIDPNTSTGRFAGATGVIFFDGVPIGDPSIGPYKSEIGGEICYAPGVDAGNDN